MYSFPHFDDNIQALKEMQPEFHNGLMEPAPDLANIMGRLVDGAHGIDWKLADGELLFGDTPPDDFYKDRTMPDNDKRSATFMVGCGLGYGILSFLQNTEEHHRVIVIEPDKAQLLGALCWLDLTHYISSGRLQFAPPTGDSLNITIARNAPMAVFGQLQCYGDLSGERIDPMTYGSLLYEIHEKIKLAALEMQSVHMSHDGMINHEMHNVTTAMESGSLLPAEGKLAGCPVVLLGAGPSLKKSARTIANMADKALLITAYQTLPTLLPLGIKPHICLALDYTEHFLQAAANIPPAATKDIPLVYSAAVHPEALRLWQGPKIPFWAFGGMGTFVMSKQDLIMRTGNNVSVAMYRLMMFMGASEILLAGQDLAWKGEQSHLEGHHAQITPDVLETLGLTTENTEGEKIFTTGSFMSARLYLEQSIEVSNIPTTNIYDGGLFIAGANTLEPDEFDADAFMKGSKFSPKKFAGIIKKCTSVKKKHQKINSPNKQHWITFTQALQKAVAFEQAEKPLYPIVNILAHVLRADALYSPILLKELQLLECNIPQTVDELKTVSTLIFQKITAYDQVMGIEPVDPTFAQHTTH
ncbi:MAG: motility associated factor glycosyltransferase family protein [Desulfovibrio sp.]